MQDDDVEVTLTLKVSKTALRKVRSDFNPDKSTDVGRAKLLAAALMSEAERVRDRPRVDEGTESNPNIAGIGRNAALNDGARCAALAITNFETGAMYLVKAITARRTFTPFPSSTKRNSLPSLTSLRKWRRSWNTPSQASCALSVSPWSITTI